MTPNLFGFFRSFRRSALRVAIAVLVFAATGALEVSIYPGATGELSWPLLLVAGALTLLCWKLVLRWSFYPEGEPLRVRNPDLVTSNVSVMTFGDQSFIVKSPTYDVVVFALETTDTTEISIPSAEPEVYATSASTYFASAS